MRHLERKSCFVPSPGKQTERNVDKPTGDANGFRSFALKRVLRRNEFQFGDHRLLTILVGLKRETERGSRMLREGRCQVGEVPFQRPILCDCQCLIQRFCCFQALRLFFRIGIEVEPV